MIARCEPVNRCHSPLAYRPERSADYQRRLRLSNDPALIERYLHTSARAVFNFEGVKHG